MRSCRGRGAVWSGKVTHVCISNKTKALLAVYKHRNTNLADLASHLRLTAVIMYIHLLVATADLKFLLNLILKKLHGVLREF
jgi:hypothetical protein